MTSSHNQGGARIVKVMVTPGLTPVLGASNTPSTASNAAAIALEARSDYSHMAASEFINRKTIPKNLTAHPSLNRVAYVAQAEAVPLSVQKFLCVQDTVTQQVVWMSPWTDIAANAFHEPDNGKWLNAAKALGTIVCLEFYDPATLHWSGMLVTDSTKRTNSLQRWQGLIVQTNTRVIVLNTRRGPQASQVWPVGSKTTSQNLILANLSELTLGVTPSSNALPLTEDWLLVGCVDGTLKCYDRKQQTTVKSIKGLGKGDWMVHLKAANPFNNIGQSLVHPNRRRIITVTKKGVAYLIELELNIAGNKSSLEIRPPLARFSGGMPENSDPILEHCLLTYDAHRDWIFWCQPNGAVQQSSGPVMNVWNLHALRNDLVQMDGKSNLIKPEPSLKIQTATNNGVTMLEPSNIAGAACGDEFGNTLMTIAVAPSMGAFFFQGISLRDPHQHRPQTIQASPVLGVRLGDLLVRDAGIDLEEWTHAHGSTDGGGPENPFMGLRIHCVKSHTLGPTCNQLVVGTNIGVITVEVPQHALVGSQHLHFGAGVGPFGKSAMSIHNSKVIYSSHETLAVNPNGAIPPKNPVDVFECPQPLHLPGEAGKRPFRAGCYSLLPSPTGQYMAILWPSEFKYEILHLATLFERVSQARSSATSGSKRNPCVASGVGVGDFCWVGDQDRFAVLHVPEWESLFTDIVGISEAEAGGVNLSLAPSLHSTWSAPVSTTKQALTPNRPISAIKPAPSKSAKKRGFGLFGKKSRKREDDLIDDDTTDSISVSTASIMSQLTPPPASVSTPRNPKKRYVELLQLVANESKDAELGMTVAPATSKSLGDITLRGGHGNIPTALFGGPVLCVGSRAEDDDQDEGYAQFYAPRGEGDDAKSYTSTGPTIPFPDLCAWDDDGYLCAIAVGSRVSVYFSDNGDFALLGIVRISSHSTPHTPVSSLKFVHGVLYCGTADAIHCVFMGDTLSATCPLDVYLLASTHVPAIGSVSESAVVDPLGPSPVHLPLVYPIAQGYQSGSLIVSTLRGVFAVPLEHPILRLGTLLASGQEERAARWLTTFDNSVHEGLACFLERRGHVELALDHLSGISIETTLDLGMRYDYVDRIEELVETHGVRGLRLVDMGCGFSTGIFGPEIGASSLTVAVGGYLLAHRRVEVVRRLASECLHFDEQGKKDALFLGALLMSVDGTDATRLIQRAVDNPSDELGQPEWPLGELVKKVAFETTS